MIKIKRKIFGKKMKKISHITYFSEHEIVTQGQFIANKNYFFFFLLI